MSDVKRKAAHKQSEFIKFPGHAQVSATDKRYEIFAGNGRIELKMCRCAHDCKCPRGTGRLNKMIAQDGSFSVSITNVRNPRKIKFKKHINEILAEASDLHKRAKKAATRMRRQAEETERAKRRDLREYSKQIQAELDAFLGR